MTAYRQKRPRCEGLYITPVGWDIYVDKVVVASVRPKLKWPEREILGWYFYTRGEPLGIPFKNTCEHLEPSHVCVTKAVLHVKRALGVVKR